MEIQQATFKLPVLEACQVPLGKHNCMIHKNHFIDYTDTKLIYLLEYYQESSILWEFPFNRMFSEHHDSTNHHPRGWEPGKWVPGFHPYYRWETKKSRHLEMRQGAQGKAENSTFFSCAGFPSFVICLWFPLLWTSTFRHLLDHVPYISSPSLSGSTVWSGQSLIWPLSSSTRSDNDGCLLTITNCRSRVKRPIVQSQ